MRIAVGTAAGLVAGGLIGYGASLGQAPAVTTTVQGPERTVTVGRTQTLTVTQTMTVTPEVQRRFTIPSGPPAELIGTQFPLHIYGTMWSIIEDEGIKEEWERAYNARITRFDLTVDEFPQFAAKKADFTPSVAVFEAMKIHSENKNDPSWITTIFGRIQGVFLPVYTQIDSPI